MDFGLQSEGYPRFTPANSGRFGTKFGYGVAISNPNPIHPGTDLANNNASSGRYTHSRSHCP
jgi:hypothetical protein